MYICVCKAITQKQLEDKMLQYNGNVKKTLKSLGVGSECGTCIEEAAQEIQKKFAQRKSELNRSQLQKNNL